MRRCCDCGAEIGPHRYRCAKCCVTGKKLRVRKCRECGKELPLKPRAQRCVKHRAERAKLMDERRKATWDRAERAVIKQRPQ